MLRRERAQHQSNQRERERQEGFPTNQRKRFLRYKKNPKKRLDRERESEDEEATRQISV